MRISLRSQNDARGRQAASSRLSMATNNTERGYALFNGNQMPDSKRFNSAALSVVIALSSVTMLWLFWRFPIPTCIGSIVLLGGLLHCVRFARSIDLAVGPD